MKVLFILLSTVFISSCTVFYPVANNGEHDPQNLQIYYQSYHEILDTFNGIYTGTAKINMWLTTSEQKIILSKIEEAKFFSFPDTIYQNPNEIISPTPGPVLLRFKYKNFDKTVLLDYPIGKPNYEKYADGFEEIRSLLYSIIYSKPEYKALPPVIGGYQ
jgi:hypothetical protein